MNEIKNLELELRGIDGYFTLTNYYEHIDHYNDYDDVEYNDLVIEKYITDNDVDTSETIYKIPEPKNKDNSKNILEYIESDLEDTDDNE